MSFSGWRFTTKNSIKIYFYMCKTPACTVSHSNTKHKLHIINGQTTIDLIYSLIHSNIHSSSIKHFELYQQQRRHRRRLWKNDVEHLEYHSKFHMFKQQMQLQGREHPHSNIEFKGQNKNNNLMMCMHACKEREEGRISCVDITIIKAYASNFQV